MPAQGAQGYPRGDEALPDPERLQLQLGGAVLTVDVFGPLRVRRDGAAVPVQRFRGAKPKQVLEVLATSSGHRVSKERLTDALWGASAPPNAVATLETYVAVLRRALEPELRARDSVVVTERGGYRVDTDRMVVDLDTFDRHVRAAAGAAPAAALTCLSSALALVRGQVLEDEPASAWADDVRDTYLPRQVRALISAGQLCLVAGDPAAALAHAERAVALNPLAEAAYQVQMTAWYAMWRQDEALAAFDRCRRLLGDELGVGPVHETLALHTSILRHDALASMVPRLLPGPALAPDRAARTPPPLLSREKELARIGRALERARAGRFTTIVVTGESGIGKTSLARAVAERWGGAVAWNRCSDLEQDLPYLALALALRSLPDSPAEGLPGLDRLLARAGEQPFDGFAHVRVMEGLASWLGTRAPFLLVLDDVQFADTETRRTLGYLHRRCSGAGIAVLVTCDRGATSQHALRALPVDLRVELDLLPASALADERLYAATGGHPMFVAGWLAARARGLAEPFPPELRERVLNDCWGLGPQAYRLLSVACCLAQPVTPAVLGSLVGVPAVVVVEELDRLVDLRVLRADGSGFAFRSPAVRCILTGLLSPARRDLLRQQAETLLCSPRRRTGDVPAAPPARLLHVIPAQLGPRRGLADRARRT